jgi:hypothetical protein
MGIVVVVPRLVSVSWLIVVVRPPSPSVTSQVGDCAGRCPNGGTVPSSDAQASIEGLYTPLLGFTRGEISRERCQAKLSVNGVAVEKEKGDKDNGWIIVFY